MPHGPPTTAAPARPRYHVPAMPHTKTVTTDDLFRGVEGVYSEADLQAKLKEGRPLRIKLGLDPTAPDIHLGHSVVLRKMRQFQELGHKAVLLIGDYTAKIGDPTGRDTTRPVLDDATIDANAQTYLDQAGKILDTSPEKLELVRNSEWLSKLSFADVLKYTGLITVQQMLHRENFKNRMQKGTEIMVSEFMYPLMQAYDSVAIEADVELGGTDQTFNCLMGRQLMERLGMNKQVVMVMPILRGLDGHEKMSKSKGNYVGLTDEPFDMFGKVMSIPDALMAEYYQLCTDVPMDRVNSLMNAETTHPRDAKDVLGRIIVEDYHDRNAAAAASERFKQQFTQGQVPDDIEVKSIAAATVGIINLVRDVGFAQSNSEARRLIEQGGVSLDGEKVTDPKAEVTIDGEPVLKVGKRKLCRVKVG